MKCEQILLPLTGGPMTSCQRRAKWRLEWPEERARPAAHLCDGHAGMEEAEHRKEQRRRIAIGKAPFPDLVKTPAD